MALHLGFDLFYWAIKEMNHFWRSNHGQPLHIGISGNMKSHDFSSLGFDRSDCCTEAFIIETIAKATFSALSFPDSAQTKKIFFCYWEDLANSEFSPWCHVIQQGVQFDPMFLVLGNVLEGISTDLILQDYYQRIPETFVNWKTTGRYNSSSLCWFERRFSSLKLASLEALWSPILCLKQETI